MRMAENPTSCTLGVGQESRDLHRGTAALKERRAARRPVRCRRSNSSTPLSQRRSAARPSTFADARPPSAPKQLGDARSAAANAGDLSAGARRRGTAASLVGGAPAADRSSVRAAPRLLPLASTVAAASGCADFARPSSRPTSALGRQAELSTFAAPSAAEPRPRATDRRASPVFARARPARRAPSSPPPDAPTRDGVARRPRRRRRLRAGAADPVPPPMAIAPPPPPRASASLRQSDDVCVNRNASALVADAARRAVRRRSPPRRLRRLRPGHRHRTAAPVDTSRRVQCSSSSSELPARSADLLIPSPPRAPWSAQAARAPREAVSGAAMERGGGARPPARWSRRAE